VRIGSQQKNMHDHVSMLIRGRGIARRISGKDCVAVCKSHPWMLIGMLIAIELVSSAFKTLGLLR
jgi:hypothetical protein